MGSRWSPVVVSRSGLPLLALAVGFACGSPWILKLKIVRPLWSPAVVSRCDLPLWAPAVGFRCGPPLVSRYVVSRCGVPLWSPAVGSRCGLPLWAPAGLPLWSPVVGSRCWPPLWATAGRALPQRIPYTDPPKSNSWGSPSFGVIGFYISKTTSGPPRFRADAPLGDTIPPSGGHMTPHTSIRLPKILPPDSPIAPQGHTRCPQEPPEDPFRPVGPPHAPKIICSRPAGSKITC